MNDRRTFLKLMGAALAAAGPSGRELAAAAPTQPAQAAAASRISAASSGRVIVCISMPSKPTSRARANLAA